MRLLNTTTFRMKEFFDHGELRRSIPDYAILSHRWGDDEVTYQQFLAMTGQSAIFESSGPPPSKVTLQARAHLPGVAKILNACKVALSRSLEWIWIDTCCIDKSSSAELSEAINSMWDWYEQSKECYAFLRDVPNGSVLAQEDYRTFRESEWFQRGWTLQELLAPPSVLFLDLNWQLFGDKTDMKLSEVIAAITKIPKGAVRKLSSRSAWSIATRISWAASRCTSRIEDRAYSLLGLCRINMPLLYGEAERAFERLQKEIVRSTDDESIFAHRYCFPWSVFAAYPADFVRHDDLPLCAGATRPFSTDTALGSAAFTLTNKGIEMRVALVDLPEHDGSYQIMALNCYVKDRSCPKCPDSDERCPHEFHPIFLPVLYPVVIQDSAPQALSPACIILTTAPDCEAQLEEAREKLKEWVRTGTDDPFVYKVMYFPSYG